MMEHYIPRSLEPILVRAMAEFPVVVLIGPRQSGKTTLLKHLVGSQWPLISLEPPDVRAAAIRDPRGFLDLYPPPVVYDEIQYAPDLLPYIKECVDARRDQSGQYILTGSQNLLLMQQVTESLAGRGISTFRRDFGDRAGNGYVIYTGAMLLPLGDGTRALPLAAL